MDIFDRFDIVSSASDQFLLVDLRSPIVSKASTVSQPEFREEYLGEQNNRDFGEARKG